jgi:CheY-like chemotaxis protein
MTPCCFHPTRVVVVDDNREFLNNLDPILSQDYSSYMYFKNPQKALYHLNEVYQPNPFPNRYIASLDETEHEHRWMDVNILDTHHEIYRPQRFEEISVVVADYSMPGMNGLELCRQIKDPHIQKILLTGLADESKAIEAFNEGIIQHFITKQSLQMVERLNQAIEAAQWRYFNRFSEVAIKAITIADSEKHAIVDPHFNEFFKKLIKQHGFREAYLCESMGSYLLIKDDGSAHGLIVNNADQLDLCVDSAEALKVDPSIVQLLREREKMMFHHDRESILEPEPEEWKHCLYDPNTLQGEHETYYYAFAPNMFDVDVNRVLPFEKYKGKQLFKIEP